MNDSKTQQLIDEALDALFETWDTCPDASAIVPVTLAHGWEWTPDGQHLQLVGATPLRVNPGITRAEVEDMARENQHQIAKRLKELANATQTGASDEGMPLEFDFTRKKKTGPDTGTLMTYISYMQEQRELSIKTINLALQARLVEWERLIVEDYEAWCEEMNRLVNEPIYKKLVSMMPGPSKKVEGFTSTRRNI